MTRIMCLFANKTREHATIQKGVQAARRTIITKIMFLFAGKVNNRLHSQKSNAASSLLDGPWPALPLAEVGPSGLGGLLRRGGGGIPPLFECLKRKSSCKDLPKGSDGCRTVLLYQRCGSVVIGVRRAVPPK